MLSIETLLPLTMKIVVFRERVDTILHVMKDSSLSTHRYCKKGSDFEKPRCFKSFFQCKQFIKNYPRGKIVYEFLHDSIAGNSGVSHS